MSPVVTEALVDQISLSAHQAFDNSFFRSALDGMGNVMGDDPFGDRDFRQWEYV